MAGYTILILEDEPIIEEYLKHKLNEVSLSRINFADSVGSAHSAIADSLPDNILLNLKLTDGWLTKKEMDFFLLDHRWQTVLVTGARPADILKDTSLRTLDDIKVLPKPFNSFQLMRMVGGLMGTSAGVT